MSVVILSDTHGNLTAFEAVLADIERRGIERIFHLGDMAGKGPRGSACCELTRRHCEGTVIGNWDVFMLSEDATDKSEKTRWWREELSKEDLEWLAELPFSIDLELAGTPIRLFHASSDDVFHRIYPSVNGEEWNEQFRNTDSTGYASPEPKIVVYGDIHHAWSRTEGEHTLLNCGAVGNPLDENSASYLILDDSTGEVTWELVRVPYDIESELLAARDAGMPQYKEWEQELRTAVYAR